MRRLFLCAFASAIMIVGSGCGDNHDKLVKDLIATENDLCDVLEKIKTPEDVEKNRQELEKLAARLKDIRERLKKLGEPDDAGLENLEKQYDEEIKKIEARLAKLDKLMSNPAIVAKLEVIFADVNKFLFKGVLHLGINPNKAPNFR